MNDFHKDQEVNHRIHQVEYALNALADLSRARGEYNEDIDRTVPSVYGEFYVNENGRYRFSWYA